MIILFSVISFIFSISASPHYWMHITLLYLKLRAAEFVRIKRYFAYDFFCVPITCGFC